MIWSVFVELDGWMAKLRFSACHLVPGHPRCGRLHGHTYAVSVRVEGERGGEFVLDFEELKSFVSDICEELDHRIVIAGKDERLLIEEREDVLEVLILGYSREKRYVFPVEDVVVLPIGSVSAEELCEYIAGRLVLKLQDRPNIHRVSVRVDEGIGQGAGCTRDLR